MEEVGGKVTSVVAQGLNGVRTVYGPHFYLPDGLGSVARVVNAAGVVENTQLTTAWGEDLVFAQALPDRHGFTQRERDGESSLMYYRARMYDPRIGRFGQPEPIFVRKPMDHYRYGQNNPTRAVDPSGTQSVEIERAVRGTVRNTPSTGIPQDRPVLFLDLLLDVPLGFAQTPVDYRLQLIGTSSSGLQYPLFPRPISVQRFRDWSPDAMLQVEPGGTTVGLKGIDLLEGSGPEYFLSAEFSGGGSPLKSLGLIPFPTTRLKMRLLVSAAAVTGGGALDLAGLREVKAQLLAPGGTVGPPLSDFDRRIVRRMIAEGLASDSIDVRESVSKFLTDEAIASAEAFAIVQGAAADPSVDDLEVRSRLESIVRSVATAHVTVRESSEKTIQVAP